MIKNKYWKRALQIAWPSVLESFFISLAGLIDTFMVSSIGSSAVAAIGLTTQPKFIALSFFIAIAVSVSALVARRKGEEDKKMANQTMVTAMIVAVSLCIIISSIFVIFTPQIIKLAGSSPDTHDLGVSYFKIIMAGMIFNVISMTINAGQRGSGNTQIAFTTNLVSSIINIFFNYLLINGNFGFPKLGVKGATIATVLG
ncbi:MAG: MATE family efflux transporter, partial [Anaerococcus obesiensis]